MQRITVTPKSALTDAQERIASLLALLKQADKNTWHYQACGLETGGEECTCGLNDWLDAVDTELEDEQTRAASIRKEQNRWG